MAEVFRDFQYPTPPLGTSDSGFRDEVEAEEAFATKKSSCAMKATAPSTAMMLHRRG
ncbi:hypothetical protein [Streptomyces sp. NPDC056660]|uniref:hypothetical protein n=1 Tax=Streptomyces sp. NPDC056660 TaxID=3345897 RepID=UPI0036C9AD1D